MSGVVDGLTSLQALATRPYELDMRKSESAHVPTKFGGTRTIASSPPSLYLWSSPGDRRSPEHRHSDLVDTLLQSAIGDLNKNYWQRAYSDLPGSFIQAM